MFFSWVVKASLANIAYLFGIMKIFRRIHLVGCRNLVLGRVVLGFNANHNAPVCGSCLLKIRDESLGRICMVDVTSDRMVCRLAWRPTALGVVRLAWYLLTDVP